MLLLVHIEHLCLYGEYIEHFFALILPCKVLYIYILVIAWIAVKFGINTTSVALKMGKISQGKAE